MGMFPLCLKRPCHGFFHTNRGRPYGCNLTMGASPASADDIRILLGKGLLFALLVGATKATDFEVQPDD